MVLVGPPGVGKSRVAQIVALEGLPDGGGWWIEVGAEASQDELAEALAGSLGLELRGADAVRGVGLALDRLPRLVILDGAERSPAAVVALVGALRGRCELLITSRIDVEIAGQKIEIPPLGRAEAQELFLERARALRDPLPEDPEAVEQIVSRLGGIPLALELAASRVGAVSLGRLARSLDRIGRGPLRGQEALDWSWAPAL